MNETNKKCNNCGELLKPSQYARAVLSNGYALKNTDTLVCRNYPKCQKAEKELKKIF